MRHVGSIGVGGIAYAVLATNHDKECDSLHAPAWCCPYPRPAEWRTEYAGLILGKRERDANKTERNR